MLLLAVVLGGGTGVWVHGHAGSGPDPLVVDHRGAPTPGGARLGGRAGPPDRAPALPPRAGRRRWRSPPAVRPPRRPASVPSCGPRHGPCSSASPTPGPGPTSSATCAAGGGGRRRLTGAGRTTSGDQGCRGSRGDLCRRCATSCARRRPPRQMATGRPCGRGWTRRRTRWWAATATARPGRRRRAAGDDHAALDGGRVADPAVRWSGEVLRPARRATARPRSTVSCSKVNPEAVSTLGHHPQAAEDVAGELTEVELQRQGRARGAAPAGRAPRPPALMTSICGSGCGPVRLTGPRARAGRSAQARARTSSCSVIQRPALAARAQRAAEAQPGERQQPGDGARRAGTGRGRCARARRGGRRPRPACWRASQARTTSPRNPCPAGCPR